MSGCFVPVFNCNVIKLGFAGVICHPERSKGSPIAQNKNMRNEILRLTAQNDNVCVGVGDSAPRCRGGSPCPPVDFDVILRNDTEVVPYAHKMYFVG